VLSLSSLPRSIKTQSVTLESRSTRPSFAGAQ
jgi:hypothetical protein